MIPTPRPAKNLRSAVLAYPVGYCALGEELPYLPAMSSGMCMAQVCKRTPNAKMATAMISETRRPSRSPIGAAMRAPKKVPALNMETIRDDCAGDIFGSPSFTSM